MSDEGLMAFRDWQRRLVANGHSARRSRVAEDAFRAGYAARGKAINAVTHCCNAGCGVSEASEPAPNPSKHRSEG